MNFLESRGISWNFMNCHEFHRISWNLMNFHRDHGISWNSVKSHVCHAIPWNARGFPPSSSRRGMQKTWQGSKWTSDADEFCRQINGTADQWDSMGIHRTSWDFMEFHEDHEISWDSMKFHEGHEISWNFMKSHEDHEISWHLVKCMRFHALSWNSMEFDDCHEILWSFMKFHEISWLSWDFMRCEGIPSKQPPERHAKNVAGVEVDQRCGRVLPPDRLDSGPMRFHGNP